MNLWTVCMYVCTYANLDLSSCVHDYCIINNQLLSYNLRLRWIDKIQPNMSHIKLLPHAPVYFIQDKHMNVCFMLELANHK